MDCGNGNSDLTNTYGDKDSFITMAMPPPCYERGNERVVYPGGDRSSHFTLSSCDHNQDIVTQKMSTSCSRTKSLIAVIFSLVPTEHALRRQTIMLECLWRSDDKAIGIKFAKETELSYVTSTLQVKTVEKTLLIINLMP